MDRADLAGRIGYSVEWLKSIETGKRRLDRYSVIAAIADALQIEVSTLLGLPRSQPGGHDQQVAHLAIPRLRAGRLRPRRPPPLPARPAPVTCPFDGYGRGQRGGMWGQGEQREKRFQDLRRLARMHGAFNLIGGLWPMVSIRSFERVFGTTVDRSVMRTCAGFMIGAGVAQLRSSGTPRGAENARRIGLVTSLAMLAVDLIYLPSARFRPSYLLDTATEAGWVMAWGDRSIRREMGRERLQAGVARTIRERIPVGASH